VTRRSIALAIAAVLAVGAAACSGDSSSGTTTTTTAAPATTTAAEPTTTTASTTTPGPILDAVSIDLQHVATVNDATDLSPRSGDTSLYVTNRGGQLRRITVTTDPATNRVTYALDPTPVLDITDSVTSDGQEQGLLGVTFSSDGRRMYIAYTGKDSNQHLDEYTMSGDRVDTGSRRPLLTIDDFAPNHNGGGVVFGPDGFLYYGMGDGGGGGDPHNSGQDTSDLLGNLLRIDPEGSTDGKAYGIPDSNPFAQGGGAPEVFAYGLRNPWRFSFDRENGDLWIGDVGQNTWEEIDWMPATGGRDAGLGANFEWSDMEGTHAFDGRSAPQGAVPPIYDYSHDSGGCSVTGGFVYRGSQVPSLSGVYVFADYCAGDIIGLVHDGDRTTGVRALGPHLDGVSSFGQDNDGELYVLSLGGEIDKIVSG
jgi:glucose/arabinose dehydrogenase